MGGSDLTLRELKKFQSVFWREAKVKFMSNEEDGIEIAKQMRQQE